MDVSAGVFLAVLQVVVLEGARALGVQVAELLIGILAGAGLLAATVYLLVSLRLAATMERIRRL